MTSPQGLAELILPARGAAQKASASFAEQLSDGDSPGSSNLFREPTQRTQSVKYRYTATGKHRSSPLKGSSSSPERKPPKSKPNSVATPSSHGPNPRLAVATTSRKRKASASKDDMLHAMFLSSPSPLSSAPTTPIVSSKALPPSPISIPDPPPRRLSSSKSTSLRTLAPTASKLSIFSHPLSSKRKQIKAKRNADAWDIGNSVWVLLNRSGGLADNGTSLDLSAERMWWPAQVVQKQPLRVSLFGDFPSSSSTSRGLCTIFNPSSSNVLSINDDSGAMRFSRATFRLTSLPADDSVGPPTKKPRFDETASVEVNWESAVQSMEKASTLEHDGLPAILSSYAGTGDTFYDSLDDSDPDMSDLPLPFRKPTTSSQRKSKPTDSTRKLKRQGSRANLNANTTRQWSPCPPDPTLQIPGELILALAPKTGSSYWPAKILEHVPARKEKYKVKFLDDIQHTITRDKFWTSEEGGFVRCTLGEWESAVKTTEDPDSGDESGEFDADSDPDADDPPSALPPPPPAGKFEDLSVCKQLAYVKPVLRAILNKEYVPAKEKHDAFMRGGSARVSLFKSAGVRGGMDTRFVKAVQKVICTWVLGDSGLRPQRLDTGDDMTGVGGAVERATTNATSSEVVEVAAAETLPHDSTEDDKMEGIESVVVPEDVRMEKNDGASGEALPSSASDKHEDSEMTDTAQEQQSVSLPPSSGVTLSPAVQQASLAAKSQLDLLAEVSQAVATEPSLLPSHPEAPKLKVDLPCKDMSSQPSPLTPVPDEEQGVKVDLLPLPKDTSSQPSPLTSVPDEDQAMPLLKNKNGPIVCEEFEILSGIEKLDYCLNILLPESIQQLLLWRSGERTDPALLSPEEEQRLHAVGARKAAETDWVDDVMRLRAAQARLWGVDLNKKVAEVVQDETKSRARRGTVSRP